MARDRGDPFTHRFEGAELLDELLGLAGSALGTGQVEAAMREGQAQGLSPGDVIPALFPEEPRFPDPALARRLYQNLLGLWDRVARGGPPATGGPSRPARPRKKEKAERPAPFGEEGPTPEFIGAALAFLEDDRQRQKLVHSFENRQDALLTHLDEQPLSDHGYGVLRGVLSQVHALLELGRGEAPRAVDPAVLSRQTQETAELQPFEAYAEQALLEAEKELEAPLPEGESRAVHELCRRALRALYHGR